MTKSEARSINESALRALDVLQGAKMPWAELGSDLAKRVSDLLKGAADEITRIRDMAQAELDPKARPTAKR